MRYLYLIFFLIPLNRINAQKLKNEAVKKNVIRELKIYSNALIKSDVKTIYKYQSDKDNRETSLKDLETSSEEFNKALQRDGVEHIRFEIIGDSKLIYCNKEHQFSVNQKLVLKVSGKLTSQIVKFIGISSDGKNWRFLDGVSPKYNITKKYYPNVCKEIF